MSARSELEILLLGSHPVTRGQAIDAYRAELLAEVAVTVRAAAPKYLDTDVDVHTFQVLNDLAAKIARGDLS